VLPDLSKDNFNLIKDNKTLCLILLLIGSCMYLVTHSFSQYEDNIKEKNQNISDMKDALKVYREATIRSAEIEKASRILKD